jgi:hypothetical protein
MVIPFSWFKSTFGLFFFFWRVLTLRLSFLIWRLDGTDCPPLLVLAASQNAEQLHPLSDLGKRYLEITFGSPVGGNDFGGNSASPFMNNHVNQVAYLCSSPDFRV